jgi:hypothetical protein
MAKATSPFVGKKLTGITSPANTSIEQRLFSHSPTQNKAEKPKVAEETREATKPATVIERPDTDAKAFDLKTTPYKPATFVFTAEELHGLQDLKTELDRTFDLKATKIDIVRCAVHSIVEDYRERGSESLIVQRIRKKNAH